MHTQQTLSLREKMAQIRAQQKRPTMSALSQLPKEKQKEKPKPKHPTRMRKDVFTLYNAKGDSVSGDRAVLSEKTGLRIEYVKALTNQARYSLGGWSADPAFSGPRPGGRPKDKKDK
ncbi:MAG: hypothetical protein JJU07_16205 [Natronohydrobacter sp.]|nr:hypothetical protein [Natronohydrobacter sp.]